MENDVERVAQGKCETCRWWHRNQSECRRHAPVFNDACGSIFPQNVNSNDWCGEYTPTKGQQP